MVSYSLQNAFMCLISVSCSTNPSERDLGSGSRSATQVCPGAHLLDDSRLHKVSN